MLTLPFINEKLMCGILYHQDENLALAIAFLKESFGEIDYQSPAELFSSFTSYYDDEMGGQVYRVFVSFKKLVDPSLLASIKIKTNAFEQGLVRDGHRPINLDPGLISTGRLLLATTKNASHRIALHSGIYVEMTLFFSKNQFIPLPWTYPDFSSESVRGHIYNMRTLYKKQIKLVPPPAHQ